MKNTYFLFALLVFVSGCRRKDYYLESNENNKPAITLNGSDNMDVNFNAVFSDPGATAVDGKGNPLVVLVEYNGFTTAKAKTFVIDYTATDGNGITVSTSRTVNVRLQTTDIAGGYSVQSDCKYSIPSVPVPINFFKGSADIVAGAASNQLEFQNIDFAGGSDVFHATLSGRNLTITGNLTISPVGITTPFTYQFNGTGTITEDARTITINYIWENITPIVGGSVGSCIAIYSKN